MNITAEKVVEYRRLGVHSAADTLLRRTAKGVADTAAIITVDAADPYAFGDFVAELVGPRRALVQERGALSLTVGRVTVQVAQWDRGRGVVFGILGRVI